MNVRVKICGLSTADTMEAALAAGADMVGLVFITRSPRNVDIAIGAALAEQAGGRAERVALVVDPDDALLAAIMQKVRPDVLQLHGQESVARTHDIRRRCGVHVWKALGVETPEDADKALEYREAVDMLLFDAKPPKGATRPGGNGVTFEWSVLDGVRDRVPYILSGGLTPDNVAGAIRATRAKAVDVSSGVESAPGVKDADRMVAFVRAAKAAQG